MGSSAQVFQEEMIQHTDRSKSPQSCKYTSSSHTISEDDNSSFSYRSSADTELSIYTPSISTTQDFDIDEFSLLADEADSGWESRSSCSTSLTPSVYDYEYAFGRRYHGYKSGKYPLPNDSREQDREETIHALLLEMLVSSFHSMRHQ